MTVPQQRAQALAKRRLKCGDDQLDKAVVQSAHRDLERWLSNGIGSVSCGEEGYPEALSHIYDPPSVFFWRGAPPASWSDAELIAIVGSRNCDPHGAQLSRNMARELTSAGGVIVSGLALGIDGMAHRGALEAGRAGATIAVLGSGVSQIYPSQHRDLVDAIVANGGTVLSHFEPEARPYPSNFLDRNRVIVGLSRAVVVVQAAARSGALVTARLALEEGRDVCAVPGAVGDPRHAGTNQLIRNGAYLVESADHVLDLFPSLQRIRADSRSDPALPCSPEARALIPLIENAQPLHIEELQQLTQSRNPLDHLILELELAGAITRLPGNMLERARQ